MHGAGDIGAHIGAVVLQIRLRGNEADGAAFRARAIQRALRPAQHLYPIEIEQPRLRLANEALHGNDRHFIEIHAHRRVADGRTNAAYGYIVLARPVVRGKRHTRHRACNILIILDMMLDQLGAAYHADAARNLARILPPLLCCDDDFLELLAIGIGRHRPGRVRRQPGHGRADHRRRCGRRRLRRTRHRQRQRAQNQMPTPDDTSHASLQYPRRAIARHSTIT